MILTAAFQLEKKYVDPYILQFIIYYDSYSLQHASILMFMKSAFVYFLS